MWKTEVILQQGLLEKKATNQQKITSYFPTIFSVVGNFRVQKNFYFAVLEKWLSGEKAQQLEATKKGGKRKHFVHIYLGGSNGL